MTKFDFLISSERSGSNLLTSILNSHSIYCGPPPVHLMRIFYPKMESYGCLAVDQNWMLFIDDVIEIFNCKIGIWSCSIEKDELYGIVNRDLKSIIEYIYLKESSFHQKTRVFVKEVKTQELYPYITNNFSDSKFIWLVRDPRDMVLSWIQSPIHKGEVLRATQIWLDDQQKTLEYYKQSKNIFLIRYEDLISDQELSLINLCDFLGIAYEENMLSFYLNQRSKSNAAQTDNWKNLDKGIIKSNLNKYKGVLSEDQIKYVEYRCADLMRQLDYNFDYFITEYQEFIEIELRLGKEERIEKIEYLSVSQDERNKRLKWHTKYLEIQNR